MKKTVKVLILTLAAGFLAGIGPTLAYDAEWERRATKPDEVYVAGNYVQTPKGRIILVRKDRGYCAIKYLEFWKRDEGRKWYGCYESYYQGDGSGDFSKKNVKHRKDTVSDFGPGMFFGVFHSWGGDLNIKCGPIRLEWGGGTLHGGVHFSGAGMGSDYKFTIELAPTPWTDISQVNVHDPRIWWYGYHTRRWNLYIPLSELWTLPEKPEKDRYTPPP
jgi:hypothetical protein